MQNLLPALLVSAPIAFVAGWLLSKSVLRRKVVPAAEVVEAIGDTDAGEQLQAGVPGTESDAVKAEAGTADVQNMQAEIRLFREAVAERDQQLTELRRQVQEHATPPEDTPATARGKARLLLEQMKERLDSSEAQAGSLKSGMQCLRARRERSVDRLVRMRSSNRELSRQCKQQKLILTELREELRQRDLQQQAQQSPATDHSSETADQQSQAAQLNSAPVVKVVPELNTKPVDLGDEEREDLQVLKGVGPALHRKMNQAGVYRIRQLAMMSPPELRELGARLGISDRQLQRTDWIQQARRLLDMPDLVAVDAPAEPV